MTYVIVDDDDVIQVRASIADTAELEMVLAKLREAGDKKFKPVGDKEKKDE